MCYILHLEWQDLFRDRRKSDLKDDAKMTTNQRHQRCFTLFLYFLLYLHNDNLAHKVAICFVHGLYRSFTSHAARTQTTHSVVLNNGLNMAMNIARDMDLGSHLLNGMQNWPSGSVRQTRGLAQIRCNMAHTHTHSRNKQHHILTKTKKGNTTRESQA